MSAARWRRNSALVAVLTAILTLLGGGAAVAHWSVSDQVEGRAQAATVGMTQLAFPAAATPLTSTYTAQATTAADAASIRNTGTREGTYTLTLQASSGLGTAITATVGPVQNGAACTPTAALVPALTQTKPLSAAAPVLFTGSVRQGETLTLCVQTSMTPADVSARAGESTRITMGSHLRYADAPGWTIGGATATFTQSVESRLLFFTDSSGRYRIKQGGHCVARQSESSNAYVIRDPWNCQGTTRYEWRITALGGGRFTIAWAFNEGGTATSPLWTAKNGGDIVRSQSPNKSGDQEWSIVAVTATEYQIRSASGLCAALGAPLTPSDPNGLRSIVLATCNAGATEQRFTFELIGNPIVPVATMVCTPGDMTQVGFSFPRNEGYEFEVKYRVLFSPASAPDRKSVVTLDGRPYRHDTAFRIAREFAGVFAYADTTSGAIGENRVFVEQQIADSPWTTVAQGRFTIARNGGTIDLGCPR
ncbi:hypothetical protein [Microbacterium sp. NPDC096154]|uniref:RICIN domain-containing protein n=1 Tax=Microbacterium sp. NPDC096154 TaxID=3155549 RepID=UPI00331944F2